MLRDLLAHGQVFALATLATNGRDYWLDALRLANGHVEFDIFPKPRHMPPPDECGNSDILIFGRPCRSLAGQWDADADLVQLAVSRTCLGSPDWVRASASVYTYRSREGGFLLLDDRWQPTAGSAYFTPRVYRP